MAARKKNKSEQESDSKSSSKKKSSSKSSGNNSKTGSGMAFIKKVLFVLMTLTILLLGAFIYFLINFDSYKAQMAEKIAVKLDSVTIDPEKLTDKLTKVRLHFKVNNGLPFGIIFKNLTFDLNVGDTKVANGMQAAAMVTLNSNIDTNVVIACNVDSIVARRAITKTVEKNAGKLLKTILSQKSVGKEIGEDIKGITTIKGSADLMVKLGSMEIPFSKKIAF